MSLGKDRLGGFFFGGVLGNMYPKCTTYPLIWLCHWSDPSWDEHEAVYSTERNPEQGADGKETTQEQQQSINVNIPQPSLYVLGGRGEHPAPPSVSP